VQWFAVAALILTASTPQATQEVTMSGISLQLPGAWTVKTDGHYALVASLSTTFNPTVMPWVTINICDDSKDHRCPAGTLDLSRDKTCSALQRSIHEWPNGIRETRWVCPLMLDHPGLRYSSATTQFEVGKRKLLVYYLATDRDTPPIAFLDDFAKALRPNDL
jgi:hypothetical protein